MQLRQIVLDTETTGLEYTQGHRIIEIGAVELINRQLTGNNFHYYLNPQCAIEQGAAAVHGLSNQFLADKSLFSEIYAELLSYLQNAELIIHNAAFDLGFLDHELSLLKKSLGKITDYCSITDTLALARKRHPGQKNNLDALCKRYHVDNSKREWHGALLDAQILAQVYLAMTGGQANLFETQEVGSEKNNIMVPSQPVTREPLVTITANVEELAAHQAYLKFLQEKSGKRLWQES